MEELAGCSEAGLLYRNTDSEIKHSTPSPTKYSLSPNKSYKVSGKEMNHSPVEYVSVLNVKYCFVVIFSVF